MSATFIDELSHRIGILVNSDDEAALHDGCRRAREMSLPEDEAWCLARLGDLAIARRGLGPAMRLYQQGTRASNRALGPWIGLAQVAVGQGDAKGFEHACARMKPALLQARDEEFAIRARGLIACSQQHAPLLASDDEVEAAVNELSARGSTWAAWHLLVAKMQAFKAASDAVAMIDLGRRTLAYAELHDLERAITWTSLRLGWALMTSKRLHEANDAIMRGLSAAEAMGDGGLIAPVLLVASDLAAQLGDVVTLEKHLRSRARHAFREGKNSEAINLLFEAYRVCARARGVGLGALAEEFVEAAIAHEHSFPEAVALEPLVEELCELGVPLSAKRLALSQANVVFRAGKKRVSVSLLASASQAARICGEWEEAEALLGEARRISEAFGLGMELELPREGDAPSSQQGD